MHCLMLPTLGCSKFAFTSSNVENYQCDQIGKFIGLQATFQSLWQHLVCPNLPQAIFVKMSKSLIFLGSEIIFGQLLQTIGNFLLVTLLSQEINSILPAPVFHFYIGSRTVFTFTYVGLNRVSLEIKVLFALSQITLSS